MEGRGPPALTQTSTQTLALVSGNCELDGLPAVLKGRWIGDVGEGNLLQCNFSQPRREKKTIAGTGRPGNGGKVISSHYSIYYT